MLYFRLSSRLRNSPDAVCSKLLSWRCTGIDAVGSMMGSDGRAYWVQRRFGSSQFITWHCAARGIFPTEAVRRALLYGANPLESIWVQTGQGQTGLRFQSFRIQLFHKHCWKNRGTHEPFSLLPACITLSAWFVPATLSNYSNQALRTSSMNATAISHWWRCGYVGVFGGAGLTANVSGGSASTWKKSRFARNLVSVLRCPDCAAGNTSGLMAKTSNIHAAAGVRPNPCWWDTW